LKIPNLLEVIYAPHKAFKKIAEKPSYVGPAIIILILVLANIGFAYVAMSKTSLEITVPNGLNQDEWTQNSTLWASNTLISENNDSVTGTYYGNASIAFTITNSTQIWMWLNNIGPVNCSSQGGFNQISFRLKQLSPQDEPQNASIAFTITNSTQIWMWLNNIGPVNCSSQGGFNQISFRLKQLSPQDEPQNASIYLFSANTSDYFYHNLTQYVSNSAVNTWNNLTLPLVSGWSANGTNADWSQITGLKLEFDWTNNSNTTMLVDGLFFHGIFHSWLDQAGIGYMLSYTSTSVMQFIITWVAFSGLLFLVGRTLGGKMVWKLLLVAVGFILITLVVQALINVVSYETLPQLNYPFSVIGGVSGEGKAAYDLILEQTAQVRMITSVAQIAIWVWTIALGVLVLRFTAQLAWVKSILASVVAYIVTIFVSSFLFG
jgi:hypothetical protein